MLFEKQGNQDGVNPHGFALTRGARHQKMGHFGQIGHKNLVRNGFAQGNG